MVGAARRFRCIKLAGREWRKWTSKNICGHGKVHLFYYRHSLLLGGELRQTFLLKKLGNHGGHYLGHIISVQLFYSFHYISHVGWHLKLWSKLATIIKQIYGVLVLQPLSWLLDMLRLQNSRQ